MCIRDRCKSQGRSAFLFSHNLTSPQVPRSPTGDEKSRRAPVSARHSLQCSLSRQSAPSNAPDFSGCREAGEALGAEMLAKLEGIRTFAGRSPGSFGGRDARQALGDSSLCGQIPMVFESISLASGTQRLCALGWCLASGTQCLCARGGGNWGSSGPRLAPGRQLF